MVIYSIKKRQLRIGRKKGRERRRKGGREEGKEEGKKGLIRGRE